MNTRNYDREFKLNSIKLYRESQKSMTQTCKNLGIPVSTDHIDFMWLDLEGWELQILQSSPKILNQVTIIYTKTNFLEFRKGRTQFND